MGMVKLVAAVAVLVIVGSVVLVVVAASELVELGVMAKEPAEDLVAGTAAPERAPCQVVLEQQAAEPQTLRFVRLAHLLKKDLALAPRQDPVTVLAPGSVSVMESVGQPQAERLACLVLLESKEPPLHLQTKSGVRFA